METSRFLLVKTILAEAVKRGAQDLHFSVGGNPCLRINGELLSMEDKEIITQDFMEKFINLILTEDQKAKLNSDREIIITYDFENNLRFKINIFYQKNFLSATLRYIPTDIPTVASLGLNPVIKDFIKFKKGLVIVAGPFGSGRSTTVAALLDAINQERKEYIITIENPIEYVFTNNQSVIEQREIGRDTKSFADALAYFQEEDGDILFVEELEDPQIIPAVLEIARGSSLVFTALTASSVSNAVSRILDSFTSFDQERVRDQLSTALKGIVCQKILPKIGGGVIVVNEIMIANEAIVSIIANGNVSQIDNIIQTSRRDGMISFDQALAELVHQHKISNEDAMDNAINKKTLEKMISSKE
ncbi:MAG: PilT/PilU family type 4a pilus ATPase [bacterium]